MPTNLSNMAWFPGKPYTNSNNHYYRVRRSSPSRRSVYSSYRSHSPRYRSVSGPTVSDFTSVGSRGGSRSAPSVFSSSSWSSRRARPRAGFFRRTLHRIKRWFRQVFRYARRYPFRVFLLVIVPLILAGSLQELLSAIGVSFTSA